MGRQTREIEDKNQVNRWVWRLGTSGGRAAGMKGATYPGRNEQSGDRGLREQKESA